MIMMAIKSLRSGSALMAVLALSAMLLGHSVSARDLLGDDSSDNYGEHY
jgi:hypothetical protein